MARKKTKNSKLLITLKYIIQAVPIIREKTFTHAVFITLLHFDKFRRVELGLEIVSVTYNTYSIQLHASTEYGGVYIHYP